MPRYENRQLLNIAREAPSCFIRLRECSGVPTVPAHSNLQRHGRGFSYKSHDCYVVPACQSCHYEIDSGKNLTREEKEQAFTKALEEYWLYLWVNEKIVVK